MMAEDSILQTTQIDKSQNAVNYLASAMVASGRVRYHERDRLTKYSEIRYCTPILRFYCLPSLHISCAVSCGKGYNFQFFTLPAVQVNLLLVD